MASCEFGDPVDEQNEERPADYSGETLQTAELQETAGAYEVTLTGDFFDSDALSSEQTQVVFTVELLAEGVDEFAELETAYESGDVIFSGIRTSTSDIEQETSPELEDGTFRATYPKDVDELADFQPAEWIVRVEFNEDVADEANPDESVRPLTFNCSDGSPLSWQPLESQ